MQKRSRKEAKQWLADQNITISEWARQNGFTSTEVCRVLNGQSKCLYGNGKAIALKLNIQLEGDK